MSGPPSGTPAHCHMITRQDCFTRTPGTRRSRHGVETPKYWLLCQIRTTCRETEGRLVRWQPRQCARETADSYDGRNQTTPPGSNALAPHSQHQRAKTAHKCRRNTIRADHMKAIADDLGEQPKEHNKCEQLPVVGCGRWQGSLAAPQRTTYFGAKVGKHSIALLPREADKAPIDKHAWAHGHPGEPRTPLALPRTR